MDVKISVVIPVFNREKLVGRAIRSVLAQTFRDFELLVVDDASTDGTPGVVRSFQDPRLVYLRLEENGGNAVARNAGVRHARGEIVSFLDSDDEYFPEFLEQVLAAFASVGEETGFVWTGSRRVLDTAEGTSVPVGDSSWTPRPEADRYLSFLRSLRIGTDRGLTVRRSCFEAVGYFDERLRASVDTDFLLRLVQRYDFKAVEQPLVMVHDHSHDRVREKWHYRAAAYEIIIGKHLPKLERHPQLWRKFHYKTGWLHYHAGNRARARVYLFKTVKRFPFDAKSWGALLLFETFGRLGPSLHRRVSALRKSSREPSLA